MPNTGKIQSKCVMHEANVAEIDKTSHSKGASSARTKLCECAMNRRMDGLIGNEVLAGSSGYQFIERVVLKC